MDIASLLSPCAEAPSPQPQTHPQARRPVRPGQRNDESIVTPALSPTSLDQQLMIPALDQQIVALQSTTDTATKASTVLVNAAKTRKKPLTVKRKRKRKRRLTPKQLQGVLENRSDDSQLYNLMLDVNELKQQVRNYMVHKSIVETRTLVTRQRFEAGVVRTTQHYFSLLITGSREWEPQEAAFFTATFDLDVAVKSLVSSVDFLFAKWKMYKTMVQMRYYGISSIRILASDLESCVVECEGEFEGRLTLTAIEMLFPHILQDRQLLERVVNRRLVCPTRTMIYFDGSGRIVQYNAQADMFAGLNRILTSTPKDVITLMSNAHLGSNSSIASDETDSNRVKSPRFSDPEVLEASSEDEAGRRGLGWKEPASPVSSIASSSSSVTSASSRSSVEYILS